MSSRGKPSEVAISRHASVEILIQYSFHAALLFLSNLINIEALLGRLFTIYSFASNNL